MSNSVASVVRVAIPIPAAASNPDAVTPILTASASAHAAASQTAQAFNLDPQAHVDQVVLALLQAPINSVDEVVRGRGPAQANAAGKAFCSAFSSVTAKFPFSPNATVEAGPAEVAALLQPGTGSLWQFYDASLKTFLAREGTVFAPIPNSPIHLNPAFTRFFNRAAALSAALYPSGAASLGLTFTARILPAKEIQSVTFVVGPQRLQGTNVSKLFTWSAQTAQQAQLIANYGPEAFPCNSPGHGRSSISSTREKSSRPATPDGSPIRWSSPTLPSSSTGPRSSCIWNCPDPMPGFSCPAG